MDAHPERAPRSSAILADATGQMSWLVGPKDGSFRAQLVIVPHAGCGAAPYIPLARAISGVGVAVVRLPTRESRLAEPSPARLEDLARSLADAIARELSGPIALFGHCSGAWIAFETARVLATLGRAPLVLEVSGSAPPHMPSRFAHLAGDMDACVRELAADGYIPSSILADPAIAALFLPAVHADVRLVTNYGAIRSPLLTSIVAWRGASDDSVPPGTLEGWRDYTQAEFSTHAVPGGHFYLLQESRSELAAALGSDVLSRVDPKQ